MEPEGLTEPLGLSACETRDDLVRLMYRCRRTTPSAKRRGPGDIDLLTRIANLLPRSDTRLGIPTGEIRRQPVGDLSEGAIEGAVEAVRSWNRHRSVPGDPDSPIMDRLDAYFLTLHPRLRSTAPSSPGTKPPWGAATSSPRRRAGRLI